MKYAEHQRPDAGEIRRLAALVAGGEGAHLEFKRRASSPDQIVREIIAFANTNGGILLVGVNDDGEISGVQYPEEEAVVVRKALVNHCRPMPDFSERIIALSEKKFVLQYDIPQSPRRPHFFKTDGQSREAYVRVRDMSMKASAEMSEIVRRSRQQKSAQFTFGHYESELMKFLELHGSISLAEFRKMSGLKKFIAARKLVTLVLANVLRITPTEKGDVYSRR